MRAPGRLRRLRQLQRRAERQLVLLRRRRTQFVAWNWLQWGFRALAPLSNFIQLDDELSYTVGPGGGGFAGGCGTHMQVVFGTADDTSTATADYAFHEFGHAINSCTRGWSAGCPGELGNPRTMVPETMSHGFGDAFAAWASSYTERGYTRIWLSPLRYNGIGDASDLMLHESEIDGTTIPANSSPTCLSPTTFLYQCSASEACYAYAHDQPRCMRRAANAAACQAMFPTTMWPYLEWAPYGTDAVTSTPSIGICKADGYVNGVVPELLLADMAHYRGYYAIADLFATNRDSTQATQLAVNPSAPTNTLHNIMALRSPRFTVTRAMHHLSTESFAWLDDAPDSGAYAEISRIARVPTTQTNGGATGVGLRFNTASDADVFLISVPPGETYDVTVNTVSTSIDLCMTVTREIDGVSMGTAGCADGTANRNATLGFLTGTAGRYLVTVTNVLGIANVGTYSITTDTRNDDCPDSLANRVAACALRPGVGQSGILDSVTDSDFFRYSYPTAAGSGPLTFTVTGPSPTPSLAVYFSANETIPSSTAIASSSSGTVTVPGPVAAGHYFVRVANTGLGSGLNYTLTPTAGTCGSTCSGSGTFASPMTFPTLEGGEVVDALTGVAPAWQSTACSGGSACDWYRVELAANERFSVTSYGVLPGASCDLEIAAFSPPEGDGLEYFMYAGERYPFVWDSGGSPDTANGGQLTFVARSAGTYRIAVRANGSGTCSRYYLDARRMRADTGSNAPPPTTW